MKRVLRFHNRTDLLLYCVACIEEAGAKLAVLRAYTDLPERIVSDVDIVSDMHGSECARILSAVLAGSNARVVQTIQHEWSWVCIVVALDLSERIEYLALDIGTDFRRGMLTLLPREKFLDGRVHCRLPRPKPGVDFAAYFAKCIDKARIEKDQVAYLKTVWRLNPSEAEAALCDVFFMRDAVKLARLVSKDDWSRILEKIHVLRTRMRIRAVAANPVRGLRNLATEVYRVWHRLANPTGLWVVLVGLDGSGKSSVARLVVDHVGPAFRRTVRTHLFSSVGDERNCQAPHEKPPYPPALSVIKALYLWMRWWLMWLTITVPRLLRSGLVITERSAADFAADPLRFRYKGPERLLRAILRLTPRPDLVIWLDVHPATAIARKGELCLAEAEEQARRYRALASEVSATRISAEGSLQSVALEVARAVLDAVEARTSARLSP